MISLYEFLVKDKNKIQKDYVDLDLPSGIKWATCNIGADKPEDYGLLFQFGRTDGYKYGDKKHKFLSEDDYVTASGTEYKKGDILKPEDDAAYQATKSRFRMPTAEEIDELLKYTDNEWTELNGMKGRKFISKKDESKWIFIPAAGYFDIYADGFYRPNGIILSSSVHAKYSDYAYFLYFGNDSCYCTSDNFHHSHGYSVRGVLNK